MLPAVSQMSLRNIMWKEPGTEVYIFAGSHYIKFKNRLTLLLDVRIADTLGEVSLYEGT